MHKTSIHLQIYFELALCIGNSLDLPVMLKQSLSAYLRKLNCSGGMVLQLSQDVDKTALEPVCSIPRRIHRNKHLQTVLARLPARSDKWAEFSAGLPLHVEQEGNQHIHLMPLPGFGLLLLVRSGEAMPVTVLKSLEPINQKLADACLACIQNEQMENMVVQLRQEAKKRQKAQDQLVLNKQKYQTIFENIQDIYYESTLDGTLLEISPSVYPILGYTRDEVLGRQVAMLYVDINERVAMLDAIRQEGMISDYEIRIHTKSGTELRLAINAVLQEDPVEGNRKIIGSMRDITRRKKAEIALADTKERAIQAALDLKKANNEMNKLNRAIEQSPTVVVITDHTGRIEYVNPTFTRLTGYTADEAIGQDSRILKSGRQTDAFYRDLWETITAGKVWEGELLNKAKDGHLYWVQAFISPVRNNRGHITHFIAIKEDISWRKAAEAELAEAKKEIEAANAARSQFLANMSHEIRTPLNGVVGMTALLLETALNDEQHDIANTIRISADSLMAAVNNVLDYVKMMAGQLNLEDTPVQLDTLLEDVVSIMMPQIGDKAIRFHHKIAADVPLELQGDAGRLKQVLINLVGNAIKFTHEGEVIIRIGITEEDTDSAHFLFSVSDTGIGIPSDFHSKLFDCFSQYDTGMKRCYGGTGMGLPISKALVKAMGGELGFSSREEIGSLFWFTVNLAKKADSRRHQLSVLPADPFSEDASKDQASHHILVVEDNPINQKLTLKIIEKLGYTGEVVSNGREAVEAVRREAYHLILMDIQMPEMDGLTATRAIRRKKGTNGGDSIPIIALTAHAMRGDRQACFEAGMDDYLTKPVNPRQLAAALAHHINQTPTVQ